MFSFWTTLLYYGSIHSYRLYDDMKCNIMIASLNHMHTRLSSWHSINSISLFKSRILLLFHVVHCRRNWEHFWHRILIHDICSHQTIVLYVGYTPTHIVILNIIRESCVPLLKYTIADHHNETISLQVTHKTFVSHIESNLIEFEYPIMSSIIRYSEAKAYTHQYPRDRSPSGIRLRHIYTFIGIHHRYNDIV